MQFATFANPFNLIVQLLLLLMTLQVMCTTADSINGTNPPLSDEEMRLLRDFVRGRGRGSVSRLAFDPDLELPEPDLVAPQKVNDGELAAIGLPPFRQPFEVVMPPDWVNKSKNEKGRRRSEEEQKEAKHDEEEEREDYEKLAKLLQRFVGRHKNSGTALVGQSKGNAGIAAPKSHTTTTSTTTTPRSVQRGMVIGTIPLSVELGSAGRGSVQQEGQQSGDGDKQEAVFIVEEPKAHKLEVPLLSATAAPFSSWTGNVERVAAGKAEEEETSTIGRKSSSSPPALPRPQILGRVLIQPSRSDESERHRSEHTNVALEQNRQNTAFAYRVSSSTDRTGEKPAKAYVSILREGFARQTGTDYTFVASITLIRDAGKVILVDTGLATDINGRTDLLKKLGQLDIAPPAVDYVVTTHGHPDHAGNTNDFPDAVHFQGAMAHHRTRFNFTDLFETDRHQLTRNVALVRTAGHTSEDISVLVHNTDRYGTVAVAGDVFIAGEDLERPMMWRPLAWNETAQEESRRRILCEADYVVPGHGKVFRVNDHMRRECPKA